MSYLPAGTPIPQPNPDDQSFWDFCAARNLRIQCCADCGRFRHPPMPLCSVCGSGKVNWTEVSGTGEVFSYTIVHHAAHPSLKQVVPYNVAVVLLDGAGDVRVISNVIDASPEEMKVGLRVTLAWDDNGDGQALPRFRKI